MKRIILIIIVMLLFVNKAFGEVTFRVAGTKDIPSSLSNNGLPAKINYAVDVQNGGQLLASMSSLNKRYLFWKVIGYLGTAGTVLYLIKDLYDLITEVNNNVPVSATNRITGTVKEFSNSTCSVTIALEDPVNGPYTGTSSIYLDYNINTNCFPSISAYGPDGQYYYDPFTVQTYKIKTTRLSDGYKQEGWITRWDPQAFYIRNITFDNNPWQSFSLNDFVQTQRNVQDIINYVTNNYETINNNYFQNTNKDTISTQAPSTSQSVDMGNINVQVSPSFVINIANNKYVDPTTGQEIQKKTYTSDDLQNITSVEIPNIPDVSQQSFDTTIEIPEKKDIQSKLVDFVSNHPLINLVKSIHLQSSGGECQFTITNPFGQEGTINFCQYESLFNIIGGIILAFASIEGALILVKV